MSAIPFPYGMDKVTGARIPRVEFRPPQTKDVYDPQDQRREMAEIARCFRAADDGFRQIERRLKALEEIVLP
jgi:hypothetical protein